MKHSSLVFVIACLCASSQALAQGLGLPLAGTAEPVQHGQYSVSAGLISGDDMDIYGVRLLFAPLGRWSLFLGGGFSEPDNGDSDPIAQIGIQRSLSSEGPIALALRAAAYMPFIDNYDYIHGFHVSLVGSKEIEGVENLSVYGSLGILHERWMYELSSSSYSVEDDKTEAAGILGVLYKLSEQMSVYLEYADIDDAFLAGGIRYNM